ncbi:MAG: hypothetical protein JWQ23_2128 [Herminiimonas sp.]|nr:hypothetical protein [Herminiimonas sp.]
MQRSPFLANRIVKGTTHAFQSLALAIGIFGAFHSAGAADLFTITGTVVGLGTQTRTFGLDSAEKVLEFPKFENLHTQFSNYSGTERAILDMNFRGLGMVVAYPTAGATELVFDVPSLGIRQSFAGATREESQHLYADFMKKNGGDILNRIMKKLVEESPYDPIAGNPNSLMSQTVSNDFANGFSNFVSGSKADGASSDDLIGIGARLSSIRTNGINSNSLTVPVSYTISSDLDPRR